MLADFLKSKNENAREFLTLDKKNHSVVFYKKFNTYLCNYSYYAVKSSARFLK